MFIELWQGLRDLMHENSGTDSTDVGIVKPKLFINWAINDLACLYDWPFLRGEIQMTATAGSGLYVINPISQLTATAQTLYIYSNATADGGGSVIVKGKQIPGSNANYINVTDTVTLIATATATGGVTFSHIDSITRAVGSGTITVVTSTGGSVATIPSSTEYVSNDISKINAVVNQTDKVSIFEYNYSTYQKGNPNGSNLGTDAAYDMDYSGKIRFMNITSGDSVLILYQRTPKYLMDDRDRTEFPNKFYSKIINAAYEGYGLRYEDEGDALQGKMRYQSLLKEIVQDYLIGSNQQTRRILPKQFKRVL